MLEKTDLNLTDPIEVKNKLVYELPEVYQQDGSRQPFSGYDPPCTLDNLSDCEAVLLQTANIKGNGIYQGIERGADTWMELACDTALESVKSQGGPFGAVLLQVDKKTGRILRYWKNSNQVTRSNDPTAHAEVMAIRSACRSLGVFNLGEIRKDEAQLNQPGEISYCIMYSSTEPCPMCYSAICWANIPILLFAATRFDAAAPGVDFSDEALYEELSLPYPERNRDIYQCTTANSLDAFNLWKRSSKIPY